MPAGCFKSEAIGGRFYGLSADIAIFNSKPASEFVSAFALLQSGDLFPEFPYFLQKKLLVPVKLAGFCGEFPAFFPFGFKLLFQLGTMPASGLWHSVWGMFR